ncbi:hypothetical protein GSI_03252 [Ganoderma sinense ZZ0214-1]|uniref:Ubiquitin 3 binding protein But2 C-terminal domain-containing protein n=1 Tax=Ganoderma sinense ZZ0214-1 TaxID=1077348 RepID=A0A2G8SL31_9APHY|nr:hypothetical protein GSI_03252 [Ganoderma sinense ZZ0214-1]
MPYDSVEYEKLLDNVDSLDVRKDTVPAYLVEYAARIDMSPDIPRKTRSTPISPLVVWLASAVLLVGCIDLLALAYVWRISGTVFQDKDFAAATLEYADPYIGLTELYASGKVNSSPIDPILVRPRVSAQVYVDQPTKLAPRGERDYWHETWGMLSPNERHLHVTPNVHTIVQFRAIDFGMEDCRLVFTLPPLGVPLEDRASFAMNPASRFDVFRLAAARPLDVKSLSYRSRPKRAERVATLQARVDGETEIHRFPCKRGSLHVFEVACAEGEECMVDVWSSQNTTYGVNVYQHQTV